MGTPIGQVDMRLGDCREANESGMRGPVGDTVLPSALVVPVVPSVTQVSPYIANSSGSIHGRDDAHNRTVLPSAFVDLGVVQYCYMVICLICE